MNIFKQILNKLKSQGNIRSFALDDDEIDTKELTESGFGIDHEPADISSFKLLPNIAKTYLFRIKFDFNNEELNKFSDKLLMRAKSINILPVEASGYKEDTNTHIIPPDSEVTISFDEFEDYFGWKFWFKNMLHLYKNPFTIDVTMYDTKLENAILKVRYNTVRPTYMSELNYNVSTCDKVTYYVKFKPESITNLI